jgi:hypothetical protein
MPRMEFEPTTPVFEWAKTIHASERTATVIRCFEPNLLIVFVTEVYCLP